MKKIYLQCGYEDECKTKKCLKCYRKDMINIDLTYAEQIVIEDFGVCDLKEMLETKPKDIKLMQEIMRKLMLRMYKK